MTLNLTYIDEDGAVIPPVVNVDIPPVVNVNVAGANNDDPPPAAGPNPNNFVDLYGDGASSDDSDSSNGEDDEDDVFAEEPTVFADEVELAEGVHRVNLNDSDNSFECAAGVSQDFF